MSINLLQHAPTRHNMPSNREWHFNLRSHVVADSRGIYQLSQPLPFLDIKRKHSETSPHNYTQVSSQADIWGVIGSWQGNVQALCLNTRRTQGIINWRREPQPHVFPNPTCKKTWARHYMEFSTLSSRRIFGRLVTSHNVPEWATNCFLSASWWKLQGDKPFKMSTMPWK